MAALFLRTSLPGGHGFLPECLLSGAPLAAMAPERNWPPGLRVGGYGSLVALAPLRPWSLLSEGLFLFGGSKIANRPNAKKYKRSKYHLLTFMFLSLLFFNIVNIVVAYKF